MTPLSPLDALFLHLETPATPMHVGALHLLQPPRTGDDFLERLRRHVAARLHLAAPFTRRLAPLPLQFADPVWIESGEIDLDWHVRRVRLPAPGSQAQLEVATARLHAQNLDRNRPLWRMTLIEGLASGQLALYTQFHHAALDGAAGVMLGLTLLDPGPRPRRPPPPPPRSAQPVPSAWELTRAGLASNSRKTVRLLRQTPRWLTTLGRSAAALTDRRLRTRFGLAPHTALNVAIEAPRRVATLSLPLAELKATARRHGVSLNDVVLAIVAGGLRTYLDPGLPDAALVAALPVSLRAASDRAFGTRATLALASLATDIDDPLERLQAIHASAVLAKGRTAPLRGLLPEDLPSFGLPWLLSASARLYAASKLGERLRPLANLVVSNVPGPPEPLWLAGARLSSWWPLSIVEHGLGLNITVLSYAGAVDFGLVSAKNALSDPARLARAMKKASSELAALEPQETR